MSQFDHESDDQSELANQEVRELKRHREERPMLRGKGKPITNERTDAAVSRCGHNHAIADCPFKFCAARALLESALRCDRQHFDAYIGHDAIVAQRAAIRLAGAVPVKVGQRTAIRLAGFDPDGESDAG